MQHDHHCWVTTAHGDFRIRRVVGEVLHLGLPCPCGCGVDRVSALFVMDPSTKEQYCRDAVAWDYAFDRSTYVPGGGRA